MKMRKAILFAVVSLLTFVSCHDHADEPEIEMIPEETILMYFPWSQGDDHIYQNFLNNISAMKMAVEMNRGIGQRKLLVYLAQSATKGALIDIVYKNGQCIEDTLKRYTNLNGRNYSTAAGISSFFSDMKQASQGSKSYSIIMGCHGMGWLPVGMGPSSAKKSLFDEEVFNGAKGSNHIETRYLGHASLESYQTEVSDLCTAIKNSFGKIKMLVVDDCYMSNIEIAYDLKDLADYYIASTSEMMIAGLPYRTLGMDLINGNYQNVCDKFHTYYSTEYKDHYGTLAVIKLSEVDAVAALMKRINAKYDSESVNVNAIQPADNWRYTIFFDMTDYVKALCNSSDEGLYNEFLSAMDKLVPYKTCTNLYWSNDKEGVINTFCGITISDPTRYSSLYHVKEETNWWKATH
ncbi:MAG: hypothetical protein IJ604_04715 [Prevotella sp.]|nr:hypothetical protein [Prevotella sp.]